MAAQPDTGPTLSRATKGSCPERALSPALPRKGRGPAGQGHGDSPVRSRAAGTRPMPTCPLGQKHALPAPRFCLGASALGQTLLAAVGKAMAEQERLPAWLGPPPQDRQDPIRASGTALPAPAVISPSHPRQRSYRQDSLRHQGHFPSPVLGPSPPQRDAYQGPGRDSPILPSASTPANPLTGNHRP